MSTSCTLPRSHDGGVIEVQFDSSGSYLASCATDGTLVVYALGLQSFVHRLELDDAPSSMRWIYAVPDYFAIVVGFTGGNLCQITFKQGNPVTTYQFLGRHTGGTVRAIDQRGHFLVTAAGSEIVVWSYDHSQVGSWTRIRTICFDRSNATEVEQVIRLDDYVVGVILNDQKIFYANILNGQTQAMVRASKPISGVAAIGNSLILSVAKCCRLTKSAGRRKISILRSPVANAKLYHVPGVPVLLAENTEGDICLWNYETGKVLAMFDARESGGPMAHMTAIWDSNGTGFILAGAISDTLCGSQSRIRIRKITRGGILDSGSLVPVTLRHHPFKCLGKSKLQPHTTHPQPNGKKHGKSKSGNIV